MEHPFAGRNTQHLTRGRRYSGWFHPPKLLPHTRTPKYTQYFFNIHLDYSLNDIVLIQSSPFHGGNTFALVGKNQSFGSRTTVRSKGVLLTVTYMDRPPFCIRYHWTSFYKWILFCYNFCQIFCSHSSHSCSHNNLCSKIMYIMEVLLGFTCLLDITIFLFIFKLISYLFSLKNSRPCWDLSPGPPLYQADMLPIELPWLGLGINS